MKRVDLKVKERDNKGSAEVRRMRKQGNIPGVLYGGEGAAMALTVEEKALRHAIGHERGTFIINLAIEGKDESKPALIKEFQTDPITGNLLHLDFIEVKMNKPIDSVAHIELVGQARGLKDGGIMDHAHREVHIRSLPNDIPPGIQCDVEALSIGDSLRVSDLKVPDGVEILDDPDTLVASVMAPKIVVTEVAEAEAGEAAGEAAGAAPEAPAEGGGEEG